MARRWAAAGMRPKGRVEDNARHLLAARMAELYALAPAVDAGGSAQRLHDLRIAAKRLRYTLELFPAVFGEAGQRQIDRMKTIQEQLGDLRDHDARIALIVDELGRVNAETLARLDAALTGVPEPEAGAIVQAALAPGNEDPRRGLIALLGREHARRQASWDAFRLSWDRFTQDGMRADLTRLSALPLDPVGAPEDGVSNSETDNTGAGE
ncbi:MAG TPA: CHAD domain-containing protein [Thermomicrobiales bacterium]|nr:CHAD domain-containing protein [Thermomicrobiales bacterium]